MYGSEATLAQLDMTRAPLTVSSNQSLILYVKIVANCVCSFGM